MVFTHVLLGVLVGAVVAQTTGFGPFVMVVSGGIGGLVPDIDMLLVHRKTTHFPVLYSLFAGGVLGLYAVTGIDVLLLVAVGLAAAALHSVMDVLGGGKEMRPWRETDDRAVYNHVTREWISPLRLFYDGSGPDLVLAVVSGILALWLLPDPYGVYVTALVVLATAYAVLRRVITRQIPEDYSTFSSFIQQKLNVRPERDDDETRQQ